MAKVSLASALTVIRGALGNIVFKQINGQLHATQKAQPKKKHRRLESGTPRQREWRIRFHQATRFALAVKENPELLAHYSALAKKHNLRLRDVCISDYFSIPLFESVDLSRYAGRAGGVIRFRVTEKYPLAGVTVRLVGPDRTEEEGSAVIRGQTWTYTSTRNMRSGKVSVQLLATDHAHQSGVHKAEWPVPV